MNDLVKCLYDFTLEKRMGSVYQDPEYDEMAGSIETQIEKVQKDMTEEQKLELRLLLERISAQASITNEHLFQAALGLARELNVLV